MPHLAGCAVEPCPHAYTQEELLCAAREVFAAAPGLDRYTAVFRTAGVRGRRFVVPVERIAEPDGWIARSPIFIEEGTRLGERALRRSLQAAGLEPSDLGHLFFITTSGMAAPSLDARILNHDPWNPETMRTPIWGLGCAGGLSGLARAADWVRVHPGKAAAVLSVEFLSLTFLPDDYTPSNLIASALFGDGVGCALMVGDELAARCTGPVWNVVGHRVRLFQDTLDIMGWNPRDKGLQVVFSKRIPSWVEAHAGAEFERLLAQYGVPREEVDIFQIGRASCRERV